MNLDQCEVFQGHDGSTRLRLHPGEGEFVCAACDMITIATSKPGRCKSCGHEKLETLTAVRPAAWPQDQKDGSDEDGQ